MTKYNLNKMPAWAIERKYGRGTIEAVMATIAVKAGCVTVVEDGAALFVKWGHNGLFGGPYGGEFVCPKLAVA